MVLCQHCRWPIHDPDKAHCHLITHKKDHRAHRLNFCDYNCVRRWLNGEPNPLAMEGERVARTRIDC